MNVNLTFFLQVINFLIAYYILDRFFFKTAVASIQKSDESINGKLLAFEQSKKDLENSRDQNNKNLEKKRTQIHKKIPEVKILVPHIRQEELDIDLKISKEFELDFISLIKKTVRQKVIQ